MARERTYRLTADLVTAHGGGPVVCLDARATGQTFKLHAERPGPDLNQRVTRAGLPLRSDVIMPDGGVLDVTPAGSTEPSVCVVTVCGPLEQRAGYHDECGGWSDGHDAVADRMIAALTEGNVVMVVDSPGGAHAGLEESVRRVVEAKQIYGRKVVAYADEMIGSAAFWWVACVADEIYVPSSGVIGSIGARSAHGSVAGALAQDGVEVTYFAWPGAGKVAFAPELPLSDVGRGRGERDVSLVGESFAAAVAAARPQLSRDAIVALDADMLTGQAAVDAGLADGVATLEDVLNYALTSSTGEANMATEEAKSEKDETKAAESYERTTKERYESTDEPDPDGEDDPEKDAEGDDEDPEGDEPPPDSDRAGAAAPPPPPPAKKEASARTVSAKVDRLVAQNASKPALKSAIYPFVDFAEQAMAATGTSSIGEALGALRTNAEDVPQLRRANHKKDTALAALAKKDQARERMDLLRKLAAADLPGFTRGELFVDEVDDVTRKRTMKPAPMYAEMKLDTLRGVVGAKLKGNTPAARQRTPFKPDAEAAKAGPKTVAVEAAKQNPVVMQAAKRSFATPDQLAAAYAAQFPNDHSPDNGV